MQVFSFENVANLLNGQDEQDHSAFRFISSAAVSIIVGKYSTDLAADNVTVTVGSGSLTATLTSSGAPVQGKTIKVTVGTIDTTATREI